MTTATTPRAANDRATAVNANELFNSTGIDWPVSGDATTVGYGTIGARRAAQAVHIWGNDGVAPRIKTTGIRVGDTIRTWGGDIVVSRVGTIAGFGYLDGSQNETRWVIGEVLEIIPA